jgi:hypothetical protein
VVPVPLVVLTVTVLDLAPTVLGLNTIVPVVHEAPLLKGTVKSVASLKLNGVADKVTGPPEAVKVVVENVQVPAGFEMSCGLHALVL